MAGRLEIRPYSVSDRAMWDECVKHSKNGTFLFLRDYMDYHSDRFSDRSLVACDRSGRIIALLPANRANDVLYSHQGLTYGGWVIPANGFDIRTMIDIWDQSLNIMRTDGVKQFIYKPVPHIYHSSPAEEDLYALFYYGATLISRQISSSIDLSNDTGYDKSAKRKLRNKGDISIGVSNRLGEFWHILDNILLEKYKTTPVHNIDEITLLKKRFPDNILLVTAEEDNTVIAGVILYKSTTVMHLQYAASTFRGRQLNVFPILYRYVIDNLCQGCRYFDFGTSNNQNGRVLNTGLIQHKSSLGGRAIVYDTYIQHL